MVTKIIHKKIGVSAEYVKFCRRVFGDENLVEIYRNSAENNIFLAGVRTLTLLQILDPQELRAGSVSFEAEVRSI